MKPISKTFKLWGGKTLKVRTDGRYEWQGVLASITSCRKLDDAIFSDVRMAFRAIAFRLLLSLQMGNGANKVEWEEFLPRVGL